MIITIILVPIFIFQQRTRTAIGSRKGMCAVVTSISQTNQAVAILDLAIHSRVNFLHSQVIGANEELLKLFKMPI